MTFKSIKCREEGHLIGDCDKSRFKSRIPRPPKENLEAGKPVHDAGTAEHDATSAEHDDATGNSGEDVTRASSYGSGNGVETQSW